MTKKRKTFLYSSYCDSYRNIDLEVYKIKLGKYCCYKRYYLYGEFVDDKYTERTARICENVEELLGFFGGGDLAQEIYRKMNFTYKAKS